MEAMRSYILSVTAAAILCALICSLAGKSGTLAALVKLMAGVVLATVIISPVVNISAVNINRYLDVLNTDAAAAVEAGTSAAREETRTRIIQTLEAYILDKAAQLSADINVTLTLEENTMVPVAVVLEGAVSPYARSEMEALLQDELGIPKEALTWK